MPAFHSYFVSKRVTIFQNQDVGEALDGLRLDARFTTNCLDVMHKIQTNNAAETN